MKTLEKDYAVEVDQIDVSEWHQVIPRFDDSNLYQTWSYGVKRWPKSQLSHLILKYNNQAVAVAQVRLMSVPLLRGVAYVRWGPLWRLRGGGENIEVFRQAVRAVKNEYLHGRGYMVQLVPRETEDRDDLRRILQEEGFRARPSEYSTLLVDISAPCEKIRSGLEPRWRTDLNRSQRNNLLFTADERDESFDRFVPIYREMFDRKKLVDFGELIAYRRIQEDLPAELKMKIMLCGQEDQQDAAGAITSAMGDTGLAVLWATNPKGRDMKGAYFLQWQVIEWLKQQGCRRYDVGGVNREENPGGYRFKRGLSGKSGRQVRFLGQFEASQGVLHSLTVTVMVSLRRHGRRLRKTVRRLIPKSH
jgi:hypothetical protein